MGPLHCSGEELVWGRCNANRIWDGQHARPHPKSNLKVQSSHNTTLHAKQEANVNTWENRKPRQKIHLNDVSSYYRGTIQPEILSALIINVTLYRGCACQANPHTQAHTVLLKGYLKVFHSPFNRLAKWGALPDRQGCPKMEPEALVPICSTLPLMHIR